jgi:outer membrane biogenesis lipoprotein LolB
MVKKVFLAAVATLLLAAATAPVGSSPAFACHGCWKAAKAAHLSTMKERNAFRKECRAHYKATHKKA